MSPAAAMVTAAAGTVDGAMVTAAATAAGGRSGARRVGFIHDTSDKHIALVVEHEGVVENVVAGAGLLNFELLCISRVDAGSYQQ